MLQHKVILRLICFLRVILITIEGLSTYILKFYVYIAHIYSIYNYFIILRLILCSLLNQLTQLFFFFLYYYILFALVCTVETMSSFSLPSSNPDQMMSLPHSSSSNIPTPESSLDSAGFYFAEPFDFSILNKSNNFHKKCFIYFCAIFCFYYNLIFIFLI